MIYKYELLIESNSVNGSKGVESAIATLHAGLHGMRLSKEFESYSLQPNNKKINAQEIKRVAGVLEIKKLRKVEIIRGQLTGKHGLFHGFFNYGDENGSEASAVVEFDNGTCDYFPATCIKFLKEITND